ncbi:membrane protein insertion efficiency factor YidD [Candidatus Gottesmanbacteria bacterium RIFCSPHIGHO2_01_FULL_39_10]|uniref:Putative membrane protein insertion efficiency factor n=1 Tax=Candidatus Gottesmanbacteria bacterium RIFCSPHIGHO2_01_FULL_39_10 TaxID=1798375 RepID=A0A1F5ZPS4_9BACT|nr:MAG: membrane protein insertion efficiency factor YidD [Candidatus Gottesmanbacteria bacterium RIFCSPHIGHO2_01_FULL_39_10]
MILKGLFLSAIRFYQKNLSSGYACRFIPTCSEYTYQAISNYGIIKGLFLGLKRILKCHPLERGGIDNLK